MDRPPIEAALPHRPPFLFLDQILEVTPERVLARRTVRADEPHFAGHYPGRPIMPGVLLCEAALQAGCYLMMFRAGADRPAGDPVVTRMNDVRFKRMVKPGDVLEIEATHQESKLGAHFLKAILRSGGQMVASLSFVVTVAEVG
jgi:3-hydroxyacyl-[acyl-carrier-protein] dehydratase